MRRKDREITDINDKIAIIEKCKFCRIGLCENNFPYIVPLNYGYNYENDKLTLFFHSALEGKKIDIIKSNNNACFEIDCDTKLIEGEKPCNYSYEFSSITGFGKIIFLETNDEKSDGLKYLMRHQTGREIPHVFSSDELKNVCVFKMVVEEFTGKRKSS
ncbi:MAG: pyridoxamine 5'-phosphate oxidase family protein [Treponema sp.]|jgi:nitroimidazol reductase NimA-like FMN-containing flavoprotein (pyridoxamine 5'-phosphate oxidase superfamily)|nr:pyridoxamine 5'-phosphate oxidase family protein [Treponema sp.]